MSRTAGFLLSWLGNQTGVHLLGSVRSLGLGGGPGGGDTVHPAVSRGSGVSPGTWTGVQRGWGRARGLGGRGRASRGKHLFGGLNALGVLAILNYAKHNSDIYRNQDKKQFDY